MVTHDELKRIAALAKLSLEGVDMDGLAGDMNGIIDFANAISEAVVKDFVEQPDPAVLREDVVCASYDVEQILSNAGSRQDGFFVANRKGA